MSDEAQAVSVARTFPQRIAVLVDVMNMYYSAKLGHQGKVDYFKLLREIVGSRHLIRAIAYIVQKPDVNQSGFHEALRRVGFETKVKELKVRIGTDGAPEVQRSNAAVELTIDAMALALRVDTIVLVSGDSAFTPLVESLKSLGCRVELVSFERSTAGEMIKAADQFIPITDAFVFKEKKFESVTVDPPRAREALPTVVSTAAGQISMDGLPKDEPAQ